MRIAFVSHPWDRGVPPSESTAIFNWEVGRRLAAAGHDVTIFARSDRQRPRSERREGVEYRFVRTLTVEDPPWQERLERRARRSEGRWHLFASPLFHFDYALAVAWNLRGRGFDVVHVHNFSQFVPLLHRADPRATMVLHMHCEWLSQLDPELVARRLRRVDLVLGCSGHITELVRRRLPRLASDAGTVYSGVDSQRFSPPDRRGGRKPLRLLYAGRISPEKGIHVLLGALPKVVARFPDVELEIVGKEEVVPREMLVGLSDDDRVRRLERFYAGGYLDTLRKYGLTDETASRVEFSGFVPHEEMVSRYREADVYVGPSLSESLGMGVMEAMASGLPVVAARVGGMKETVVDGRTGILVEPDDPDALADGIVALLEDEDLRARLGAAGRERAAERFHWDRIARDLLDGYSAVRAPVSGPTGGSEATRASEGATAADAGQAVDATRGPG